MKILIHIPEIKKLVDLVTDYSYINEAEADDLGIDSSFSDRHWCAQAAQILCEYLEFPECPDNTPSEPDALLDVLEKIDRHLHVFLSRFKDRCDFPEDIDIKILSSTGIVIVHLISY